MTHIGALPDEFAGGHASRVMETREFEALLAEVEGTTAAAHKAFQKWRAPVRLKALALASGLEVADYIFRHTMLPLASFLNEQSRLPDVPAGNQGMIGWKTYFQRAVRGRAFLCERCIEDDSARYGVSYWHLSHQMPGCYACPLHDGQPLSSSSCAAFDTTPSSASELQSQSSPGLISDPTVSRYTATSVAMHALRQPFAVAAMRAALIRRGRAAGLRLGPGGDRLLLSDVALDLLPAEFFQEEFGPQGRVPKIQGRRYAAIDAVLWPTAVASVSSVALAFTLLYDSVQEAFAACLAIQEDRA